ncbi:hypothetical protein RRG08_017658 [Elysia crispata]|uniref:Uncharacterized protein n=1 Tax=Elysia crispata TaxID=231223 RepID=A0AAE1DD98_9GAST|nr:hypothetical protein RRG08_017658 [Elysia crispata]
MRMKTATSKLDKRKSRICGQVPSFFQLIPKCFFVLSFCRTKKKPRKSKNTHEMLRLKQLGFVHLTKEDKDKELQPTLELDTPRMRVLDHEVKAIRELYSQENGGI